MLFQFTAKEITSTTDLVAVVAKNIPGAKKKKKTLKGLNNIAALKTTLENYDKKLISGTTAVEELNALLGESAKKDGVGFEMLRPGHEDESIVFCIRYDEAMVVDIIGIMSEEAPALIGLGMTAIGLAKMFSSAMERIGSRFTAVMKRK